MSCPKFSIFNFQFPIKKIMSKLHIKKGDTVYVNAGESKGSTGRVLKVYVDKQRALV
jgi:ribosomal protein S4E